jgi:hypothetical protein
MADTSWLEIFRGYSNEELLAKLAELKQCVSAFSSQNAGTKGFTTDLNALKEQLSSATRVASERGLITVTRPKETRVFVTDFSQNG